MLLGHWGQPLYQMEEKNLMFSIVPVFMGKLGILFVT